MERVADISLEGTTSRYPYYLNVDVQRLDCLVIALWRAKCL